MVLKVITELKTNTEERLNEIFIPLAVRNILRNLEEQGCKCIEQFKASAAQFYTNCLHNLNRWTKAPNNDFSTFNVGPLK